MTLARLTFRCAALTLAVLSAACSPNRLIGNQVNHFSLENVFPEVMKSDDIPMVCHANETNIPLLMSFSQFGVDVNMLLAFGYSGAAACLENDAHEKELWSEQAGKQGLANMAQDARIAQQLLNRDAGKRLLRSYQHGAEYFQRNYHYAIGEGTCPKLKKDNEQLLLLITATSALQALQNDIASGRLVDVDMAIPPKVARSMSCLDNEKWWGMPKALQASLQIILPGEPGDEAKGWTTLQDSTDVALQTGVRLSHATYAAVAAMKSRDDYLRDALKRFEAIPPQTLNRDYALLDQIATLQIRRLADLYWMRNEGHRAPTQNFSQFWDEKAKPSTELNQLLDGL